MYVMNAPVVISVVNSKGGVGKTTISVMLGCALARTDRVLVLDADPQGSASMWAKLARDSGDPLPFRVQPANVSTLRDVSNETADWVVIDTPPGDSPTINAALRNATLVVIPTDTSALDMQRTWATMDAASGIPRVILISKADRRTTLYRDARNALEADDTAIVLDTAISRSQANKKAVGTNPTELWEFMELADEVKGILE